MLKQTSNNIEYDCWLQEQIDCLKSQNFAGLDLKNLIEELESLGRAEKSAVKSLAFQILLHLLLVDFWTEQARGSVAKVPSVELTEQQAEWNRNHWKGEIIAFKFQLSNKLTTNYKKLLAESKRDIYAKARASAIAKTGLRSDRFPEICPYTLEDLVDDKW